MAGTIERVQCDPYDYTVPETGEVVALAHSYEYVPEELPPAMEVQKKRVLTPF